MPPKDRVMILCSPCSLFSCTSILTHEVDVHCRVSMKCSYCARICWRSCQTCYTQCQEGIAQKLHCCACLLCTCKPNFTGVASLSTALNTIAARSALLACISLMHYRLKPRRTPFIAQTHGQGLPCAHALPVPSACTQALSPARQMVNCRVSMKAAAD